MAQRATYQNTEEKVLLLGTDAAQLLNVHQKFLLLTKENQKRVIRQIEILANAQSAGQ